MFSSGSCHRQGFVNLPTSTPALLLGMSSKTFRFPTMSSHTHNFTFTKDPERISNIQNNMREGREREQLPHEIREKMDVDQQFPSAEHIQELRKRAGLDK
jgi:hypothetical protein